MSKIEEDDGNVDSKKRFGGIGPAWTYDKNVERPEGVEDRGSCTLRVYTKEQQERYHIDKFGKPKKKKEYVDDDDEIIILKIGGSSITDKAREETLNQDALDWFAKLVTESIDSKYLSSDCSPDKDNKASSQMKKKKTKFIIVHGAGSFGHHSAKRYGLKCGKAVYIREKKTNYLHQFAALNEKGRRLQMQGLCKTRQSVQKLNAATVSCLIKHGVNAVGVSPGISIPNLRAHGATDNNSAKGMQDLCASIEQCLQAGLVPVLHGDACLLCDNRRAGILGGDTIVEGLATVWNKDKKRRSRISKVVFITDVDGVYSSDPKSNDDAKLIRSLKVDRKTGDVTIERIDGNEGEDKAKLDVRGSSHHHDVTGGLKAKLLAAATIVQSGVDVIISQCNSACTRQLVRGEWNSIWDVKAGTLLTQE